MSREGEDHSSPGTLTELHGDFTVQPPTVQPGSALALHVQAVQVLANGGRVLGGPWSLSVH